MILVLDTSILIDLEKGHAETIDRLRDLAKQHPFPAQITFITQFEFLYGITERGSKNKAKALEFLSKFAVMNTTVHTAHTLAQLKQESEKKAKNMSLADLIIASLVIEKHFTLITRDRDFEKINELNKMIF